MGFARVVVLPILGLLAFCALFVVALSECQGHTRSNVERHLGGGAVCDLRRDGGWRCVRDGRAFSCIDPDGRVACAAITLTPEAP